MTNKTMMKAFVKYIALFSVALSAANCAHAANLTWNGTSENSSGVGTWGATNAFTDNESGESATFTENDDVTFTNIANKATYPISMSSGLTAGDVVVDADETDYEIYGGSKTYKYSSLTVKSGTTLRLYATKNGTYSITTASVESNATLRITGCSQSNYELTYTFSTMNLASGAALEFNPAKKLAAFTTCNIISNGTVKVAITDGATIDVGTNLVTWTTAPAGGEFVFADATLAAQYDLAIGTGALTVVEKAAEPEPLDETQIYAAHTNSYTCGKIYTTPEAITVTDSLEITGRGGAYLTNGLEVAEGAILVLDPVHMPIKLSAKPTISGKLALKDTYKHTTIGKMVLMTWEGDETFDTLPAFTNTTGATSCTLSEETAPNGTDHQLILKLGDYDNAKKPLTLMPIGDSITEGAHTSDVTYVPNYRIPLCTKLEAIGYEVTTVGWLKSNPYNGADVLAPDKWRAHSGRGGEKLVWYPGSVKRGGIRESIEALLDQAGTPDVITLKIGTNDLGHENIAATNYIASLTNVLWRIHNYRPTTKVVLSTLLDLNVSGYKNDNCLACGDKIRGLFADNNPYGFPENFLFLCDAFDAVPRTVDGVYQSNYLADTNVHPNWNGHDKFSDVWLVSVTNALSTAALEGATVTNTLSGAESNVPAAYREGFTQAATLKSNSTFYLAKGSAPTYTTLNSNAATTSLDRVAYYIELKRKGSDHRRWAWVDFEAFNKRSLATTGFPGNYTYTGLAKKLHVVSNDPAVHTVAADDDTVQGWLQLYPNSYSGAQSGLDGAPQGNQDCFDWNDTMGTGSHGRFNVNRIFKDGESPLPAEVVFSYNCWASKAGVTNEVGIGNFAQHATGNSIEYTGLYGTTSTGYNASSLAEMSAAAYEVIDIEIWTKPLDYEIPTDYTWTGGGEDGSWANPTNWGETVCYPGWDGDTDITITITNAASVFVPEGMTASVTNLTLSSAASFTFTGGTLNISDNSVANGVDLNGGTFIVAGGTVNTYGVAFDPTAGGTLKVTGGTLNILARVSTYQFGLTTDCAAAHFILDGGTINIPQKSADNNTCKLYMGDIQFLSGSLDAKQLNLKAAYTKIATAVEVKVTNDFTSFISQVAAIEGGLIKRTITLTNTTSGATYDVTKYYEVSYNQATKVITGTLITSGENSVVPTIGGYDEVEPLTLDEDVIKIAAGNVKAGLYYGLSTSTDLETFTAPDESALVQATKDDEAIVLSAEIDDETNVGYYRIYVTDGR